MSITGVKRIRNQYQRQEKVMIHVSKGPEDQGQQSSMCIQYENPNLTLGDNYHSNDGPQKVNVWNIDFN